MPQWKLEDLFKIPSVQREIIDAESGENVDLTKYVQRHPVEERDSILEAFEKYFLRDEERIKWITEQLKKTLELPNTLYKYIPLRILQQGHPPTFLRSTPPSSLNDLMECTIQTRIEHDAEGADWNEVAVIESHRIQDESPTPEAIDEHVSYYKDLRISRLIQKALHSKVGVVSFSTNPLSPTMWAHYAENFGVVIGYKTDVLNTLGFDLRRILYIDFPPVYTPNHDNKVRLRFVDEIRQELEREKNIQLSGVPLMPFVEMMEFPGDWKELSKLLFIKGKPWEYEEEVRLLVDQEKSSRPHSIKDKRIRVLDIPLEAVSEIYVGARTPRKDIEKVVSTLAKNRHEYDLKFTDSFGFQIQEIGILRFQYSENDKDSQTTPL